MSDYDLAALCFFVIQYFINLRERVYYRLTNCDWNELIRVTGSNEYQVPV